MVKEIARDLLEEVTSFQQPDQQLSASFHSVLPQHLAQEDAEPDVSVLPKYRTAVEELQVTCATPCLS